MNLTKCTEIQPTRSGLLSAILSASLASAYSHRKLSTIEQIDRGERGILQVKVNTNVVARTPLAVN